VDWEGAEALEDCGSDVEAVVPKATAASTTLTKTPTTTTSSTAQKQKKPKVEVSIPPSREPPLRSPSDESDDPGSEDDYVAEDEISKSKGKVMFSHSLINTHFKKKIILSVDSAGYPPPFLQTKESTTHHHQVNEEKQNSANFHRAHRRLLHRLYIPPLRLGQLVRPPRG
jgi:hypothetical protein